jgi:hypothetical protein
MITGVSATSGSSRSLAVTSSPSISGIITSSNTSRKGLPSAAGPPPMNLCYIVRSKTMALQCESDDGG